MLYSLQSDPSFLVGGIPENFHSSYRLGNGELFAIEGDEYDSVFFDKGPKFWHYQPNQAIITGVEFDHADIYRGLHFFLVPGTHRRDCNRNIKRLIFDKARFAAGSFKVCLKANCEL